MTGGAPGSVHSGVLLLRRTVRFAVGPEGPIDGGASDSNSYAGRPSMVGLGSAYELDVVCRGDVHPVKSYLIDIKEIDKAVRSAVVPLVARGVAARPQEPAAGVLREGMMALRAALSGELHGSLHALVWRLTPRYSIEMTMNDTTTVLLRQRFDFAASHRLHAPTLSAEENRRVFGKCNYANGHGHNYQIEPVVAVKVDARGLGTLTLQDLERAVDETILQRYDHRHLNLDTPEFNAGAGGVNPSVENIARVFFERLSPAVARSPGATLRSITVWETDRTSCTYPG